MIAEGAALPGRGQLLGLVLSQSSAKVEVFAVRRLQGLTQLGHFPTVGLLSCGEPGAQGLHDRRCGAGLSDRLILPRQRAGFGPVLLDLAA